MLVAATVPAVTLPVPMPIVATVVAVLLQVPLPGLLVSVVVLPLHMASVPAIGVGSAFTVSTCVAVQPVPKE